MGLLPLSNACRREFLHKVCLQGLKIGRLIETTQLLLGAVRSTGGGSGQDRDLSILALALEFLLH